VLRTLVSFRVLILAFGIVAVGIPIALVGELGIARTLGAINVDVAHIRQGQLAAAAIVQLGLDAETSLRGYASTRQRSFLAPFSAARAAMPAKLDELTERLHESGPPGPEDAAIADLRSTYADYLTTIGDPVAAGAPFDRERAIHANDLIQHFRADMRPIEGVLDQRYREAIHRRDATIAVTTYLTTAAIAAIGLEVIVFGFVVSRMRYELDRERAVVELLQVATSARLVPPAHARVGTAYRSATRGVRVGGDLFDVYRLDDDRTLLVIADVSGKGLVAAVDTTFVRYGVRALAAEALAPDQIVTRFDALYRGANPEPEAFVTLFVGIHEHSTGTLTYTNAGHEACWIRDGQRLTMLAPTGPIIGLGGFPFTAVCAPLRRGELLILATDGLTEARARDGAFVTMSEVNNWLRVGDGADPQVFADAVLATVAARTRGNISDDLALLVYSPSA
jgi:CHASE3 domain sensor protein